MTVAFDALRRSVHAALETYSNVHRGAGHHSMVTTRLYEQARTLVLDHLGLKRGHEVVFCSPATAGVFLAQLDEGDARCLSSQDLGLPLGVRALVLRRRAVKRLTSFPAGGGTARLVGPGWVVWARAPGRFEAGTPPIVNVIAFARALQLTRHHGPDCFRQAGTDASPDNGLRGEPLPGLRGRELLEGLRALRIGRELQVPTADGSAPLVNLDHAASTPTFTPVWEAVWRAWRLPPEARPGMGRDASRVVAGFLDAPPADYDVLFTANATEAIHLAARNLSLQPGDGFEPVVLNTLLEHNSNELPWRGLEGVAQVRLEVDREGFVDPARLEAELAAFNRDGRYGRQRIRLVCVSGASNVLGSMSDLEAICRAARSHGARVLVDAAQLVAHRRVSLAACGADYLVFAAHKAYAPFGTGVLVARRSLLAFAPDELERVRASGEENTGGLAGLAVALGLLRRIGLDVIEAEERALTERALAGLAGIPGLKVYGIADAGNPRFGQRGGVIAFDLKGSLSYKVAGELAERAGVGIRWGCHCAHMLIKDQLRVPRWAEQLQRAMVVFLPKLDLPGVARVSMGIDNTPADIDLLVGVLARIARDGAARRKALKRSIRDFVDGRVLQVYGPSGTDPNGGN
ncbi:MAG: aminotransferase class V-fold PLP-dependent enzyme [Deltaproteobacteria bacterium]|nr:aminotransferase class V-fold PLP-dependent enzyme [Deltaproteobacteria bacterium]